ncbi:GGDEF and EAL domain-containing protein [Leptolyngbya sp. BL0902]|uniref:GGDEF and EAL domain-containing protein n=1 Tax=Leptolyngbya sp. BL0902 TaxID=1115757 RepID=UPI0018E6F4E7|nr:GGDEF and EAL domain-containing protein [Leptolyngbya sp. BL0902]
MAWLCRYMPKTIRGQLRLGFGVILILHGLSAVIGYSSLQRLRYHSQTTLNQAHQVRELSLRLQRNFLLARRAEREYFDRWRQGEDPRRSQHYIETNEQYLARARENLTDLKELTAKDADFAPSFALLAALFENYEMAFQGTIQQVSGDGVHHNLYPKLRSLAEAIAATENPTLEVQLWQLLAQQQAYMSTHNPAYLSDLQRSLDQADRALAQPLGAGWTAENRALAQTYLASMRSLLLLDQQVQVSRIVSSNINRDIDQILDEIGQQAQERSDYARQALARTAHQSSAALVVTALSALGLAVGASVLLGRRIIQPLDQLVAAAERIARQDLDQPLELTGEDEFAAVADAFNHMATQVRSTLANLEQRVEERTEALAQANQALQEQTQSLAVALQRLGHSEANYRLLVDHLQAGVIVHAPDTTITMCNRMGSQLLGFPVEDILGQGALEPTWPLMDESGTLIPVEQYPVNRVLATGRPMENQLVGIRHSEQPEDCTWALINAFPTFDEQQQINQVVVTFIDISDRKLAEEELRHQALHDALTGLPNRTLFTERLDWALERAKRYPDQQFAVLFIDLDRFKVINDSLGHLVGDQLLIQIAQVLLRHIRSADTVARLGGDEFVILLESIATVTEVIQVVERIQTDMKAPFTVMGHTIFTSASLGVALGSPKYQRGDDLLRDADNAMYRAKARGPSSDYEIFNPAMHESAIQLFEMETHLRQALERQEFVLHYQPIVHLASQTLVGFEALVRWQHPQRGLVAPIDFIPLAEETGLMVPLSDWIFETACRQMATWQQRRSSTQSLRVNVNVAAAQFEQPEFPDYVAAMLGRTGLPATSLGLEVTESMLLSHGELVLSTLSTLQRMGVSISIDDFGTGYSSLSYLKRFPIDTLKIDQSFVENIDIDHDDVSIVTAIIQIAKSLGMAVVAEGVETKFQAQRLRELNCDAIQGFLVARSLTADQAETLIQTYAAVSSR